MSFSFRTLRIIVGAIFRHYLDASSLCMDLYLYTCIVQVVIESDRSAVQYGSLLLKEGEPIKQDMALDITGNYLYAMTDTKVNDFVLLRS